MKTRQGVLLLMAIGLAAGLAGCSCQRTPDPQEARAKTDPQAASATVENEDAAPADSANAAQRHARDQAFSAAVSVVHRYLTALPGTRDEADAMWTGGRPSPVPDDANLRSLEGLQSLRIETDKPLALDQLSPPEAVEVPVRLTARMAGGNRHYTGWYRVRPRLGESHWEISSASLQPTLD
ncbi:MAG TPA: hypothetical protein VM687_00670 [Stenotrophomonas sp.]|nr:hypothetical protein [Stenotrophomonas sp.]